MSSDDPPPAPSTAPADEPPPSPAPEVTPPAPPEWHADVVTTDGRTVHLRPISPQDVRQLRDLNDRVSDQTVYFRFFSYRRQPSDKEMTRLVTVDFDERMAFVVEDAGVIIGVGRYDRTDPGVAEVAFLVEDEHQGRGIGTLLLEHLAVWGRRHGIERFTAYTLPENRKMLGVFRSAGFRAERSFVDGLIEIEFPITHIDPEPLERRDQKADAASVARILNPAVVAVVGASRDPESIGHRIFRNVIDAGFGGTVHPVNPSAAAVAGVRAYPSIAALPDSVDLAVIAVPAADVPGVVTECAAAGVHAALIVSAGIGGSIERGDQLAAAVTDEAHRLGMRIIGPASFGLINTDPGIRLHATFGGRPPQPGPLGLMSQSGMLAASALAEIDAQELGLSSFVSAGARLDVSGNDLMHYWETDPATRVIALYLEDFGNPRRFSRIARRVSATKPVVAIASQGDDDAIVEALFRQAGIVRVATLPEMVDVARVLSLCPPMVGTRVLVLSNEGGAGQMCASALRSDVLVAATPSPAGLDAMIAHGAVVDGEVIEVPFEATGDDWHALIELGLRDEAVDAVIVTLHTVETATSDAVVDAISRAAAAAEGKPLLASLLPDPRPRRTIEATDGSITVPVFEIPEVAAHCLARAARYAEWRLRRRGSYPEIADDAVVAVEQWAVRRVADGSVELSGSDLAPLLEPFGLPLPPSADQVDPLADLEPVLFFGIDNHPAFGPLVTASLGLNRGAIQANHHVRLAPLTDADAAALLRNLPGLSALSDPPNLQTPALIDLVCRLGAVAAEIEYVASLRLGPVPVTSDRPSGPVSASLAPAAASAGIDARQLD